jgi:hypothetical protein
VQNHVKILFRLPQDADGYPPVAVESVWATNAQPGIYLLDNIPFFTREATLGDAVLASDEKGDLWFTRIQVESTNSLVRVVLFDVARLDELRQQLTQLGCSTEWDEPHNLVAVNVPDSADLSAIQNYLQTNSERGWFDYEEPILRQ